MYVVVRGNAIDIAIQNEVHFGHGCNCFNRIKSGVAKEVRDRLYPMVEADDRTVRGDRYKLGSYSYHKFPWGIGFNFYTQYTYSREGIVADYDAIRRSIGGAIQRIQIQDNRPLVIPKIGSGLAGGDWATIEDILQNITPRDFKLVVVEYDKTVSKQPIV
ncbi:hypothetical protein pEaSNUABM54_00260 [Erwinia phage pEa_SNUABM_54]|nr:hypothetical protein pEaSNUABM54_00260 [Erwinia phage pEa_SNUABM_54]